MKDFYEHIDVYIKNQLSVEDRKLMEEAMAQDAELKAAVENHDLIEKILDANIEDQLRMQVETVQSSLDSAGKESKPPVETKPKRNRLWFIILGVIFAVLALLLYSLYESENADVQYATFMETYEFPENRGTRSAELISTKLDSAIYFFDLRRFGDSEKLIDEILISAPDNEDAIFYKAHLLFHRKELDQAKKWIETYGLKESSLGRMMWE